MMDELLMRGMPHSAEAEQAVLGSMLIDGDCVKDVMDQLQAEDFYCGRTGRSLRPSPTCSSTPSRWTA